VVTLYSPTQTRRVRWRNIILV